MSLLSERFAPYAYGIIQSLITTAVATAVATLQLVGMGMEFLESWPFAWLVAWITMLPIVILIAPLIQRAVKQITAPSPTSTGP